MSTPSSATMLPYHTALVALSWGPGIFLCWGLALPPLPRVSLFPVFVTFPLPSSHCALTHFQQHLWAPLRNVTPRLCSSPYISYFLYRQSPWQCIVNLFMSLASTAHPARTHSACTDILPASPHLTLEQPLKTLWCHLKALMQWSWTSLF